MRKELARYHVLFVDYGNEARVESHEILYDVLDIPDREVVDINVEVLRDSLLESMDACVYKNVEVEPSYQTQKWSIGNDCLARS